MKQSVLEPDRRAVLICIVFTGVSMLALLSWITYLGFHEGADFVSFYTAGALVVSGAGEMLYDAEVQAVFQRKIFGRPTPLPYYHPAFEALLFAPLSLMTFSAAYLAWAAVNVTLLMTIPFLLRPHISAPGNILCLFLVCFLFFPIWVSLLQGQDSVLLLLLYVLAYRRLQEDQDGWAGALLALGLFKFHLVLPAVIIIAATRGRRFAGWFMASAFTLAMISIVTTGGARGYISFLLSNNRNLAFETIKPSIMPNLRGLVSQFGGDYEWVSPVVGLLSLLVLLASLIAVLKEKSGNQSLDLVYALALITTLLVSYHLNPHDLSLLLLPVLLLMERVVRQPRQLSTTERVLLCVALLALYQPITYVLLVRHGEMHKGVVLILVVWLVVLRVLWRSREGRNPGIPA